MKVGCLRVRFELSGLGIGLGGIEKNCCGREVETIDLIFAIISLGGTVGEWRALRSRLEFDSLRVICVSLPLLHGGISSVSSSHESIWSNQDSLFGKYLARKL